MKFRYIFFMQLIILLLASNNINAQLEIVVDSIRITHIKSIRPRLFCVEGFSEGPIIHTYFSIINKSSIDTLFLTPSKAKIEIKFNYHNKPNTISAFPVCILNNGNNDEPDYYYSDSIVRLDPNQKKGFYSSEKYLMGFLREKKMENDTIIDWTIDVIESLPTLQVWYSDGIYEAVSNGIKKILVDKYPVYYKVPKKFYDPVNSDSGR